MSNISSLKKLRETQKTKVVKEMKTNSAKPFISLVPPVAPAEQWEGVDPNNVTDPRFYMNREVSLLSFHQRVLDQAKNEEYPLLERVKFLAIAGSNLNEVFMIRIAVLLRRMNRRNDRMSIDGLSTRQIFHNTKDKALALLHEVGDYWSKTLRPLLEKESITFIDRENYSAEIKSYLKNYYVNNLHKVLTPLAFDPGRPFPHISNLSLNLAVVVRHNGVTKFARVKIPNIFPRFIRLPAELVSNAEYTFVFLEDIIKDNINELFCDVEVVGVHMFRIARDTYLEFEDDDTDDVLETVNQGLEQLRYGDVTLLQVEETMPDHVLDILAENFELRHGILDQRNDRMEFKDWFQLTALPRPDLKLPQIKRPVLFQGLEFNAILERIRQKDYLIHQPFESFEVLERFLEDAAHDPNVIAIKMTLYRVDKHSNILDYLIQASQEGKQVSVLVELKARFDEHNNINWAKHLESHGIHVAYGLLELKTHCKLCLVLRQEKEGIRSYMHIGTGNYNSQTSKIYTDLGLFTSHPVIASDVTEVFNSLTGYSNRKHFNHMMVAPMSLRNEFIRRVEREIEIAKSGKPAHFIFKFNSLEDREAMKTLIKASQAGVKIDLIVRGICCLRPGIPGITENIRVVSLIGRFLEHSRIYYFLNGGQEEIFIGSADLMERNLSRRVETLCPIFDDDLKEEIKEKVLKVILQDNQGTYLLSADGKYQKLKRKSGGKKINAQEQLIQFYSSRAR